MNKFPAYYYYIKEAINRGYSFDFENQILVKEKTKSKPKLYGSQRYPSCSINIDGKVVSFPIHKFCAYLLYGDDCFGEGVHVRHLDGDSLNLSKENLVLGTASQNELDKCAKKRSMAAKIARASQGHTPMNAKLTKVQVEEIRNSNETCRKLGKIYGVSFSTISNVKKGKNYGSI